MNHKEYCLNGILLETQNQEQIQSSTCTLVSYYSYSDNLQIVTEFIHALLQKTVQTSQLKAQQKSSQAALAQTLSVLKNIINIHQFKPANTITYQMELEPARPSVELYSSFHQPKRKQQVSLLHHQTIPSKKSISKISQTSKQQIVRLQKIQDPQSSKIQDLMRISLKRRSFQSRLIQQKLNRKNNGLVEQAQISRLMFDYDGNVARVDKSIEMRALPISLKLSSNPTGKTISRLNNQSTQNTTNTKKGNNQPSSSSQLPILKNRFSIASTQKQIQFKTKSYKNKNTVQANYFNRKKQTSQNPPKQLFRSRSLKISESNKQKNFFKQRVVNKSQQSNVLKNYYNLSPCRYNFERCADGQSDSPAVKASKIRVVRGKNNFKQFLFKFSQRQKQLVSNPDLQHILGSQKSKKQFF